MTNLPANQTPGPDHRSDTPNAWIHNPDVRKYLYLAVAAIVAGLVMFGVITQEQIAEWATVTVAVLAIGTNLLAARNAPGTGD